MKKILLLVLILILLTVCITGCSGDNTGDTGAASSKKFDTTKEIVVISREDGSGTRGAFIELFGIEIKNADGNKVDMTTIEADITNSTSVMMISVENNPYAIGYISLGSLNDTVKSLTIDGAAASSETIKSGEYEISRPFILVTQDKLSEAAEDFMDFIMSKEGQDVIEANGYISVADEAKTYTASEISGKIVVAGSSSVTPVMEKLKEAYLALNPLVELEVQQSDSTTGITSALDGICDIGMTSRGLKDSELEKGLTPITIAMDGIVVIVSHNNPIDNLTKEQVRQIYTEEVTIWDEIE